MSTLADRDVKKILRRQTLNKAKRMHEYYILLLIPVALLVIFKYVPIYGIIIAFKDFSIGRGIHDSPWNNFEHFKRLFQDPFFYRITRNTVIISVYRIIFGFPAPIILAMLLNEIRSVAYKKTVQTLSYLPHFVSWVVLAGIFVEILSSQRGPIAHLFTLVGLEPVSWLTVKPPFGASWWSREYGRASAGAPSCTWHRSPLSIPACTRQLRSMGPTGGSRRSTSPCPRSYRS